MTHTTGDTSPNYTYLTGLDIQTPFSPTASYIIAYTADRTKQVLISIELSPYSDASWRTILTHISERLDEDLTPGADEKHNPGKAVQIYLLVPEARATKATVNEFYKMTNGRVLFRIANQSHTGSWGAPFESGVGFRLRGAPDPGFHVGETLLNLHHLPFTLDFDTEEPGSFRANGTSSS